MVHYGCALPGHLIRLSCRGGTPTLNCAQIEHPNTKWVVPCLVFKWRPPPPPQKTIIKINNWDTSSLTYDWTEVIGKVEQQQQLLLVSTMVGSIEEASFGNSLEVSFEWRRQRKGRRRLSHYEGGAQNRPRKWKKWLPQEASNLWQHDVKQM